MHTCQGMLSLKYYNTHNRPCKIDRTKINLIKPIDCLVVGYDYSIWLNNIVLDNVAHVNRPLLNGRLCD